MKNKNQGFTLIEMLVVIAMIGLLSAVVLVALGPSRNKAKDTRIISDINQARAIGETKFDPINGVYALCNNSATDFASLASDISAQGGALAVNCNPSSTPANSQAAYSSSLNGGGNYCVDTTGKTSSSTATNGSC